MNEHLFEEIRPTSPQHTRRIIMDEGQAIFVAYCTVCAWHRSLTSGDNHTVDDILVGWATHLEKVLNHQGETEEDFSDAPLQEPFSSTELDAKGHPV